MSLLSSSANQAIPAHRRVAQRGLVGVYLELAKARLSALVLLTAAVGFVMASPRAAGIDWVGLLLTIVGTGLAAGAANALNQVMEARRDELMRRTRHRPLPSGAIGPGHAVVFSLVTAGAGLTLLALAANLAAAGLGGGFAMLPVVDRTGRLTGQVVVLTSLCLVPLALAATLAGLSGWVYAAGSVLLGLWILSFGARLYAQRTEASARRLFLASIVYLPVLLCLMVADRGPVEGITVGPQAAAVAPAE
jgi:heme O synthase-like polyprenyltransferase